ncbi:hypothetical protein J1614_012093 [Plenodomus biglobosus]|nr:hypothetical protein J1614_012093 [Plenodomus biglobosus]
MLSTSNNTAAGNSASLPRYSDAKPPPAYTSLESSSVMSRGSTSKSRLKKLFNRSSTDTTPVQTNEKSDEAEAKERKSAVLAMYYATR